MTVLDAPTRPALAPRVQSWLCRPWPAVLVLFGAYLVLSVLVSTGGSLGTDTGGKLATLEVMTREGTVHPDIGYWAAELDPTGRLHPLWFTSRAGDRWVNVTTLPMIMLAAPLYAVAGVRGALVLPMLGGVLCALAARALARRAGATRATAWQTFWLVGLATPTVVYALDVWEHPLGLAAMAAAVVLFADAVGAPGLRAVARRALAGGALVGLAATMRTEALAHGAVAAAVLGLAAAWFGRCWIRAVVVAVASGVGVLGPVVANSLLEHVVIGKPSRVDRAGATAASAGSEVGDRVEEGLRTTFALTSHASYAAPVLLGLGLTIAVAATVALASSGRVELRSRAVLFASVGGVLVAAAVISGPGFVPGLFVASPVAGAGLLALRRGGVPVARLLALVALASLPVVWWFQYRGGAGPQWGGRYVLVSALVLTVLGMVQLSRAPDWARLWCIALAVAVTASGLWWLSVRTHAVAGAADELVARPEAVLVSVEPHLFREIGAVTVNQRWLTARNLAGLERAFELAGELGEPRVGLVQVGEAPSRFELTGWVADGVDRVPLFDGQPIWITSYVRG